MTPAARLLCHLLAGVLVVAQATAATPVDVYILTGQSNSLGTTRYETDFNATYPGTAFGCL